MKINQIIAVLQAFKDSLEGREIVSVSCFENSLEVKSVEIAKDFTFSVGVAGADPDEPLFMWDSIKKNFTQVPRPDQAGKGGGCGCVVGGGRPFRPGLCPTCRMERDEAKLFGQRQSGRTTRMVNAAIRMSKEGKVVYIVAANALEAGRIDHLVRHASPSVSVTFVGSSAESTIDMESMTANGASPQNSVILVDHYAIETKFRKVLEMLHRWDA